MLQTPPRASAREHAIDDPIRGTERLIDTLRATIDRVLQPILARTDRVALVGFPAYGNVGDSAIWLGTLAYLEAAGKAVCYTSDDRTYARARLARRLGRGMILIHGGGSFGDIWDLPQRFREQVVEDFPHTPIVQLPQSVHFRSEDALARARAVLDAHADLTIMVRDRPSLAFVQRAFRAPVVLSPDLAFCLGPLRRAAFAPPVHAVLRLARTDRERADQCADQCADPCADPCADRSSDATHRAGSATPAQPATCASVVTTDWLTDARTPMFHGDRWLRTEAAQHPRLRGAVHRLLSRTGNAMAAQRLRRGCATLSTGRVVITDRLHAHVLSLLLGIPHVLLDNNYGKVRALYETWTSPSALAHWADSAEHALVLAAEIAR